MNLSRAKIDARCGKPAKALFAANCGVCHTTVKGGLNNIGIRVAGRTLDSLNAIVSITENLGPFMTPFTGSEPERLLLASYIYMLGKEQGYIKIPQAPKAPAAQAAAREAK